MAEGPTNPETLRIGVITMKRGIQFIANTLGYEVHKKSWFSHHKRIEMMNRMGINLVLDVGANNGLYASSLRQDGYKDRIWSYEPLGRAFAELRNAAASDKQWRTVNSACGAQAGSTKINVANNSYSSSLLPMLELHSSNAPESEYVAEEVVSVCSLDDDVVPSLVSRDKVWLKIDTQGFEAEVLKGAHKLMSSISALECELSLAPLYEGQPLIDAMLTMIYSYGFRMVGLAPGFCERETGYALQIDGIFVRA